VQGLPAEDRDQEITVIPAEAGTQSVEGSGRRPLFFYRGALGSRLRGNDGGHFPASSTCPDNPRPSSTLEGLKEDGKQVVPGIFAAVPYCVDLIGGPYLETNDEVCKGFRPKTAIRK
jgi:hypothetical protein